MLTPLVMQRAVELPPVLTIAALQVFDQAYVMTAGGPSNATQTIATQSYERSFVDFKFGEGAALSNILIIISLIFAVLLVLIAAELVIP